MRDLIGVNLVKGIGVGIDVETPNLQKDIDSNMSGLVAKMQSTVSYETAMTSSKVVSNKSNLPDYSVSDINSGETIIGVLNSIKNSIDNVDPKILLDGRELIQSTVRIIKDELNNFETRDPRFSY